MKILGIFSLIAIIFISGCATQVNEQGQETPTPTQEVEQTPPELPPGGALEGEVELPPPPALPTLQEITLETDDNGYYLNGQKLASIPVVNGNVVKITFNLRTQGVYSAGAEYRGCDTSSPSAPPGGTTSLQFTASSSCTITAFWPASGVAKASLQIVVA